MNRKKLVKGINMKLKEDEDEEEEKEEESEENEENEESEESAPVKNRKNQIKNNKAAQKGKNIQSKTNNKNSSQSKSISKEKKVVEISQVETRNKTNKKIPEIIKSPLKIAVSSSNRKNFPVSEVKERAAKYNIVLRNEVKNEKNYNNNTLLGKKRNNSLNNERTERKANSKSPVSTRKIRQSPNIRKKK